MSYTSAEATAFYEAARDAYLKCLSSKEYNIKDRGIVREKLDLLRAEMDKWKKIVDDYADGITPGKIKIKRFVPKDVT